MSERTRTKDDSYPETTPDQQYGESGDALLPRDSHSQTQDMPGRKSTASPVSSLAQWNWTAERTLADWRQSSHAWPGVRKQRARISKRPRLLISGLGIFLLFCSLVGTPLFIVYHGDYENDLNLAHQGLRQIETAGTLLKKLTDNPFNSQAIASAQQDFAASSRSFTQLDASLQELPGIVTILPHYGSLLSTAQKLVPIALEMSQAGGIVCHVLDLATERLHNPISTQAQGGLTPADFQTVRLDFNQIQQIFDQATIQISQLSPDALTQLDPHLGSAVQLFRTALPQIQDAFQSIQTALSAAPLILGIGSPTTYLVEMLDSTELRPGGGFIGNYGILTLSGGLLSSLRITDIDLLDRPYEMAGHTNPLPGVYSWFPYAKPSWGMRDSNLDADFPTTARYGEQLYRMEGGTTTVQGVIAITPWLIQDMLKITGPIVVTEYHETITTENLVDRIHYHQLQAEEGKDYVPDPSGHSSLRKRFTEILFEHFLARVQQLASTSSMSKFVRVFLDALHTKDIQVYLNNSTAEALLAHEHIASTIEAPPTGDSLMIVDANIIANKANYFITTTVQDQVTLDGAGNATHHTTLTYSWPKRPGGDNDYGKQEQDFYYDYVRIYMPPGSIMGSLQGLRQPGTSTAFGREVWSGFFQFDYGNTRSVTLDWTLPKAATKDATGWHYHDFIERQAGITWQLNDQLTLPSCATAVGQPSGFTSHDQQHASVKRPLTSDLTLSVSYRC